MPSKPLAVLTSVGAAMALTLLSAPASAASTQNMTCNMTGGSSGGPWFTNYNESAGVGTLNSLNSFKYNLPLLGNKMYGPYFGSVIQAAYNNAQGL